MATPDFSKYSITQLQQILTRIDRDRFPERVEEIHSRLVQLEAERLTQLEAAPTEPRNMPPEIAGFWRRVGAFAVDCLLLGLTGLLLGLFLHGQFEAMGYWGRAVGFLISLFYFGVMESRLFNGATFGKRALGIQLVTTSGKPLGVGKTLLRTAVFTAPYFLNGVNLAGDLTNFLLPSIQGLVVFGLGGAIVYLSIFNRRTRQSVHDLLVGTIVVRAGRAPVPSVSPVWKGHFATIAGLFVLGVGAATYGYSVFVPSVLQALLPVQQQVSRLPGVRYASVVKGTNFGPAGRRTNGLAINVVVRPEALDEKTLVRNIAGIALTSYLPARQLDNLSVTLMHGYDIGIASSWRIIAVVNDSPGAWQDTLDGNKRSNQ